MSIDTGSGFSNYNNNNVTFVPGVGPANARLFLVGEAPARTEVRLGRPFCGPAGEYLDHIIDRIGLPLREMIYITNVIKVPVTDNGNEKKTEKQISDWEWMLHNELETHKPAVVASLGSWATRWFLRNYSPGFPDTNDLDWLHGVPRVAVAPWGQFILVPCFHPAGGLHDTNSIPKIWADMEAVRDVMSGKLVVLEDKVKREYRWVNDADEMHDAIQWLPEYLGVDTEGYPHKVDLISFTSVEGQGWVIKDKNLMVRFAHYLQGYGGTLVVHNLSWDLKVLSSIGLDTRRTIFKPACTMQMAKYLNTEPGGLKALAWRLMGVEMNEYADIIRPVQKKMTIDYLTMLNTIEYGKPESELIWENGQPKVYTPQSLNRYTNRILGDLDKDPKLDVVARWKKVPDQVKKMGMDVWGPMPEATLTEVEPETAMRYSGQDADVALGLYWVLIDKLAKVYGNGVWA